MTFNLFFFFPFSILWLSFEVTLLNLLKNIYVCLVNKSSCKLNPCWEKVQVSSLYKLTDNCVNLQPLKRKEKKATLITLLSFTLHLLSSDGVGRWVVEPRILGEKARKAEKKDLMWMETDRLYLSNRLTVGLERLLGQTVVWPIISPSWLQQSLGEERLRAGLPDSTAAEAPRLHSLGHGLGWSEGPLCPWNSNWAAGLREVQELVYLRAGLSVESEKAPIPRNCCWRPVYTGVRVCVQACTGCTPAHYSQ